MTLKFAVSEDMAGLGLEVTAHDVSIRVGASKRELRRLLIDLVHTLDYEGQVRIPEEDDTNDDSDRFVLKVPKGERVGMSAELYDFLKENGRLELFGEARVPGRGVVSDTGSEES